MVNAGEEYLESMNHLLSLEMDGNSHTFAVKTKLNSTPWTLCLRNDQFNDIDIDLVPAVTVDSNMMTRKLKNRLIRVMHRIGYNNVQEEDIDEKKILAIALKTDSYKFEIDCHQLERELLYDKGCAKMVVRLIKYLRNVRKGPLEKLTSHMIKSIVMEKIMMVEDEYWNNLETAFVECTRLLIQRVKKRKIFDIIFPTFNILKNKIKDETYLDNMNKALANIKTLINDLTQNIDILFYKGACCICNAKFTNSDGSCNEKGMKKHLATVHDIRTWCSGGITCTCIKVCVC